MRKILLGITLTILSTSTAFGQPGVKIEDLYTAIMIQDIPLINALIGKGADVNQLENGRPLLGWAAQNGNKEVVEILLKAGANPNAADNSSIKHTPLMRAVDMQNAEIVRVLLGNKADPNALNGDGNPALFMAIDGRKPEVVKELIAAGADVKFVSPEGDSAVLTAAQFDTPESLEIIKQLAKAGAPMDVSNAAYTPLLYAVQQENKELVKTLLEAGANPNGRSASGQAPIQSAGYNAEIMELLLKAKADPNTANSGGQTMLFEAIQNSREDIAKLLVQAGADTKKPDYTGALPAELAERYGLTELAALLKST